MADLTKIADDSLMPNIDAAFAPRSLEELASPATIARSDDAATREVRAILASVTPDTVVTDGTQTCTFRELAKQHLNTGISDPAEAWGWAFSDLVFGGFKPARAVAP